jgi:hypothetical protein
MLGNILHRMTRANRERERRAWLERVDSMNEDERRSAVQGALQIRNFALATLNRLENKTNGIRSSTDIKSKSVGAFIRPERR